MSRIGNNVTVNVIERVEVGRDRYNSPVYEDQVTHSNLSVLLAENGPSDIDKLPGDADSTKDGITVYVRPAIGISHTARIQIVGGRTHSQVKPSEVWSPPAGFRAQSLETLHLGAHLGS